MHGTTPKVGQLYELTLDPGSLFVITKVTRPERSDAELYYTIVCVVPPTYFWKVGEERTHLTTFGKVVRPLVRIG